MSLPPTLIAGALVRFLVPTLFPSLTDALAQTAEISTPIDSFRSLKEAFFYLESGIDVYDGGMVHHPPLLVAVLHLVHSAPYSRMLFNALFAAIDVGIAYKLTRLNEWYNRHQGAKIGRTLAGLDSASVASLYLFNPLVLVTNWLHSTAVLSHFLVVEALVQAVADCNVYRGAIALGVAAFLSFFPLYLVVPYVALAYAVAPVRNWHVQIVKPAVIFFFAVTSLMLVSFALSPLPDFLYACYWTPLLFGKITPNLGLWWYIFTEMFDFFTSLYKGIFTVFSFVFVVPFTLRFFEYADSPKTGDCLLAFVFCWLWVSFAKPYPIVGDLGLALLFLPLFKNTVLPYVKFVFFTILMLITCLLLSPIFYYCWIVLGNGNSNFFYSMSLVYGVVHVLLFLDFVWGRLVYDYIQTNDVKVTTSLRLTQL